MPRGLTVGAVVGSLLVAGCGDSSRQTGGHDHSHGHGHAHTPPHGGTAVELGQEAYHLEFVHDAAAGKLSAYVFDGHLENFVRIKAGSFDLHAQLPDRRETLTFKAVTSNATGETVGDTALFEASADWLKMSSNFQATLPSIQIRGTEFTNVVFSFPKGSDRGAGTAR